MPIARCGIQFSWDCPDCESDDPECIGCPIRKKTKVMKHIESYVDEDTGEIIDVEIDDELIKKNNYDFRGDI